jgi:hypothetical protein
MKKRTKAQKIKTETKRQVITDHQDGTYRYVAPSGVVTQVANQSTREKTGKMNELFHYDIGLIAKDLQKTVVATVFIVVLLIVVTIYLR